MAKQPQRRKLLNGRTSRSSTGRGAAPVELAADRFKQHARWQEAVAALGQIALTSTNLSELLTETVRRIADTLQIDFVEILELSEDGQSLVMRAGHGWTKKLAAQAKVNSGLKSQAGFTLLAAIFILWHAVR